MCGLSVRLQRDAALRWRGQSGGTFERWVFKVLATLMTFCLFLEVMSNNSFSHLRWLILKCLLWCFYQQLLLEFT